MCVGGIRVLTREGTLSQYTFSQVVFQLASEFIILYYAMLIFILFFHSATLNQARYVIVVSLITDIQLHKLTMPSN